MSTYPKWLYHAAREAVVVADEAAHKALGPGWFESPADVRAVGPDRAAPTLGEEPKPKRVK